MVANADRLAVLIDADNATASAIDGLLKEVSKYGTPTVKRAYGDWTTSQLKSWKDVLHKYAIQPEQQFSYTKGKNSTDSALIIDAMDLLYSRNFTGFCIVSSDSDYTRLATRIRQDGVFVYGFGERKTPEPFVAACDKFVFLEIFKESVEVIVPAEVSESTMQNSSVPISEGELPDYKSIFMEALDAVARDDGWAFLGQVGDYITKNYPSFDPRNYGFKKLSQLAASLNTLDVKHVESGENKHMHVKLKSTS
ncbi:NYN domain-containing protein [Desulfocurvibacter africanus]|uniref:HTH OST-type domain-containing protein n=1 Tax=Desulfocurvibacter africanus subsp. africanus str. Walvis Bay TaxID=690850 RepID=F3YZ80_DESAF|nr:NYN domain-containing protein [Desulfocurvibacter africanus]EGJ50836.1 protein of unknown function DUF88 [Desulfocurvibacter africanus subsp. africanus str. Walvis Bay]